MGVSGYFNCKVVFGVCFFLRAVGLSFFIYENKQVIKPEKEKK